MSSHSNRHEGFVDPRKVLLVTSEAPTQSPFSTSEKRPPLGIGFLISVLRLAGHDVRFIDNYLQPSDFLESGYLQQNDIDFVGVYANTICFRDTRRMFHAMERLRQTRQWQGKIIVGGPHTSVALQTIPDFVDYVVQGEGERAILDVVEGRVTERVVRYPRIENLDDLPMPAWDCFVKLPYKWEVDFFSEKPVFTMNTSRGCPFGCTFCSVGSIWGKHYTCFSADRVVADVEHVIGTYGAKGIYFREDNFTLDPKRLRRFCQLMMEKGIHIPWVCESRVSTLTRELVELMAQAGLRGFYFGVESGSQRMLDFMKKGITVEQTENAFRWCHEFGVKPAASVVVGVPSETEADVAATQQLLQRVRPQVTWTNVFVGIPDSPLYRHVLDSRAYEYIDDRGLVYLRGHNDRVRQYYRGRWNAEIADADERKDWTGKPKISVLMAAHNGERFVREALASIYHQTYQDFEVVIVDDGSTDRTPEILLEMKDARTSIHRNQANIGLTKSLNLGLRLCRGEYVARMDADDLSDPKRFEEQVRFLNANPNCLAVGTWCHRIDAEGQVVGHWKPKTSSDEVRERLMTTNAVTHGSAMIRRVALVQARGYNETYPYAQDYDLWLRLSEKGDIQNLPEHLYSLRSWEGTITSLKTSEQEACAERARREAGERRKQPGSCATGKDNARAVDCFAKAVTESNKSNFAAATAGPRLSVILTTYNRPQLLARVLDGFARQTLPRDDFEIVVVDDGSVPPVKEIAEGVLDRVQVVYLYQENSGLAAARNAGLRTARGEIVLFSDDDDVPSPELVAEHLRSHRENPDEQVAVLGHLDWHPDLRVTALMHYVTHVGGEYFGFDKLQDGHFYNQWKWWGGLISAKRSLLESVRGPFDHRLRFGYEDTELVCRLLPRQVRVLYNAKAKSWILRPISFREFCRRCTMQGRALQRVAALHPDIIMARYRLQNASGEYDQQVASSLERWADTVERFEVLLEAQLGAPGSVREQRLSALHTCYGRCFRGYLLKGYVEECRAIERGVRTVADAVNGPASESVPQEAQTTGIPSRERAASAEHGQADASVRDRPLNITFVNTNTPGFDRGSSNVRIYHILKILAAAGHKIDHLYQNCYEDDARYKAAFGEAVRFIRVGRTVDSFRDYLHLNDPDQPDCVWITNLWTVDYGQYVLELTRWLRQHRPRTKIIMDTMDFHHKKFVRRFDVSQDPEDLVKANRFLDLERQLYPLADVVVVVTDVERQNLLDHVQANLNVAIIPNIHAVPAETPPLAERRHICYIGSFRVKHNLDAVRWFQDHVLGLILREAPDVEFHIMGHGNQNEADKVKPHPNVKMIGYVEDAEAAISQYRLFVCPMVYGSGMKGKMGTAAGAGTAMVTTSIGAEGFGLTDGLDCFIADDPQDFARKCLRLLREDSLWHDLSENARRLVLENFGVEMVGRRVLALVNEVVLASRSVDPASQSAPPAPEVQALAELERKYRVMPQESRARQTMTRRLCEMARRMGLMEKSRAFAQEALAIRRALESRKAPECRQTVRCHEPVFAKKPAADMIRAVQPKVTVITACRNAETFLPECLDSVRNQTLQEWELFLIDDASRDGTRSIIQEYARQDARIKPCYFDTNEGPYVRRNFAIERANSDFVVIQDADDIMLPTKLAILYNEISKDSRLAMVGSLYRTFVGDFKGLQYTECNILPLEHEEIIAKFKSWCHAMSHGSAIIRRALFDQIGPYDENPFASDSFWSAKLSTYVAAGAPVRTKNVPECLTLIRMHATNQTRLLSTLDPRNRRLRFRQYCELKLQNIREKMASTPGTDIGRELRNCKCSDFLVRFKDQIAQWENEPPNLRLIEKLLESAVLLFNSRYYISCFTTLNGVESMEPMIVNRVIGFELLRGMALYALDVKERSKVCLGREIRTHNSPAARQFLAEAFCDPSNVDVQDWCARNAEKFRLGLTNSRISMSRAKLPSVDAAGSSESKLQGMKITTITTERSAAGDATGILAADRR